MSHERNHNQPSGHPGVGLTSGAGPARGKGNARCGRGERHESGDHAMTVTELADWVYERTRSGTKEWDQCVAELRSIPDLEKRLLTEDDVQHIRYIRDDIAKGHQPFRKELFVEWLSQILDRIAPTPPVEWVEPVPGVHVTMCNGWSLCVTCGTPCTWSVHHADNSSPAGSESDTIDEAKSSAEKWARKNAK